MAVESDVEFLRDLDPDSPAEGEVGTLHEGNDHIRNIKAALVGQFPGLAAEDAPDGEDIGVNATYDELNILSGATITTTVLNELGDVTATSEELNILDGATITTAELNFLEDVTSAVQEQLDGLKAFSVIFSVDTPENDSWTIIPSALFGFTVSAIKHKSSTGTASAQIYASGSAVGSSLSITSALTTTALSPEVAVAAAAALTVTFSSVSDCEKVTIQLDCERS